jgi:hypothetical protein
MSETAGTAPENEAQTPAPESAAQTSAPDMVALVTAMAKLMANHPDEVEVESFDEDGATILELLVAPDDVTRMIGRGGRIARAMRTIVTAASAKLNQKFELDIVEEDDDEEIEEEDDNRGNRA